MAVGFGGLLVKLVVGIILAIYRNSGGFMFFRVHFYGTALQLSSAVAFSLFGLVSFSWRVG